MPDANGKTSLGKSNYTDSGVNFFSDDHVTGFTPLMQLGQSRINGVYNVNDDGEQLPSTFTPPQGTAVNIPPQQLPQKTTFDVGLGAVDFFSNKDRPGFIKNISGLGTYSVYNKSENAATSNDSWSGWNINESSLMQGQFDNQLDPGIPNAFNSEDILKSPSDNLETPYTNDDRFVPEPNTQDYDAYNELPEPMLNRFQQLGSRFGTEGLVADAPEPPAPPNFAEVAFQSREALNNSQGGGVESLVLGRPSPFSQQIAVGMGIEATGGGAQDIDALSQELNLDQTLDSALNNIDSNFSNDFNGIL